MKRAFLAFLGLLALASVVFAQTSGVPYSPQTLPGQTVVGRYSATAGATEAVPFSRFASAVNTAWLATNNTFTGSSTFTGNNTFSGTTNTFSGTNTFTTPFTGAATFAGGVTFAGNNTFSGTNTFSNTTTLANTVLGSSSTLLWGSDLTIRRGTANTLALGPVDAAVATQQAIQAHNVLVGTSNTAGAELSVIGSQGTGTGCGGSVVFYTAPAGTSGSARNATAAGLELDCKLHLRTKGTAPALTSCGTSPAITGNDTAGIVTMGTTATGCVITFNIAYTSAPFCIVKWIATQLASQSYVTANTAITLTQTSTSNNKIQYICLAQTGG